MKSEKWEFKLDERNLAKQLLFWTVVFVPVLLFITFGIPVWKGMSLGFSKKSYENFLDVSKLPLYFLSLSVPLGAIVAYIHRTIQTEKQISHTQTQISNTQKQIELVEKKNTADSYYAHIKFFIEALGSIPNTAIEFKGNNGEQVTETFEFIKPYALYKKIFPKSSIENGYSIETSDGFKSTLERKFMDISEGIHILREKHSSIDSKIEALWSIELSIDFLCDFLSLKYNNHKHLYLTKHQNNVYFTHFETETQLKEVLKHLYDKMQLSTDLFSIENDFLEYKVLKGKDDIEDVRNGYLTFTGTIDNTLEPIYPCKYFDNSGRTRSSRVQKCFFDEWMRNGSYTERKIGD